MKVGRTPRSKDDQHAAYKRVTHRQWAVEMTFGVTGSALTPTQPVRLIPVILICTAVAFLEGFDILSISIAAPQIATQLGIHHSQMGEIFAIGQAGMVLGALIGGGAGDRFGRRNIVIAGALFFGVFSLSTILTTSALTIEAARAFTGVGIGMALPNLINLAVEYAPDRHRGALVSVVLAGQSAGGVVVALLGASFLAAWGWKSLFYIGGLAPLVLLPALMLLPRQRPRAGRREAFDGKKAIQAVFGEQRGVTTLLLWTSILLTAAVLYMMVTWLPSLLTERGYSAPVSHLSSAMFSGGSCIGALVTGYLVDRLGYPTVLPALYGGVLVGICGVLFAHQPTLILGGALILGLFVGGSFYSLNGVSPLYYPGPFRGLGAGAAVGFGRIGSIIGPLAAGSVLQTGIGSFPPGPAAIPPVAIPLCVLAGFIVFLLTRRAPASAV